jgi:undecaprenyl-diphosphatase
MNSLDRDLFYGINGWSDSWSPFYKFLSQGIDEWPVRIVLLALIVWLAWKPATRVGALVGGLMWPFANEVTDIIKHTFPMPRPCQEMDVILRIGCGESMGTASGHSANMMFVGVVFTMAYGWKGSPMLVLAVFTGISRAYVGAHYPSQIVFGWIMGALCGFICLKTVEAFIAWRKPKESESPE